jgi:radical SAM protein with 4Fe4S-binding SPASM domain
MDLSFQHKSFCIQIELVFGCQLRCKMCGINSVHLSRRTYQFMEIELAEKIAKEIKETWPNIRIEFAMCGEPTQHPQLEEILILFRKYLPNTHMLFTTNGVNFLKHGCAPWAERLKVCNILVVDCYEPYGSKLERLILNDPKGWTIHNYYDKDFNQHHNQGGKGSHLVIIPDLIKNAGKKRQRILFNHAGNSLLTPPTDSPLHKTCTFPFREMVIRFNGDVNICCLDFASEYVIGNVSRNTIEELWYHDNFNSVRKFLYHKQRVIAPCVFCDTPSGMRSGMLPKYEKPTESDIRRIIKVNKESPRLNKRKPTYISYQKEGLLF